MADDAHERAARLGACVVFDAVAHQRLTAHLTDEQVACAGRLRDALVARDWADEKAGVPVVASADAEAARLAFRHTSRTKTRRVLRELVEAGVLTHDGDRYTFEFVRRALVERRSFIEKQRKNARKTVAKTSATEAEKTSENNETDAAMAQPYGDSSSSVVTGVDSSSPTPRGTATIPKRRRAQLVDAVGVDEAEALIAEFFGTGMAAGVKTHVGPAFVGWLEKTHDIALGAKPNAGAQIGDLATAIVKNTTRPARPTADNWRERERENEAARKRARAVAS